MALYATKATVSAEDYNSILKKLLHDEDRERFKNCTFVLSDVRVNDELALELMFVTTEAPEVK